ncbi:Epsin-4 [Candida viswanathii]|uniref:Epsin-4 n=1 Tax=Candida viswanathii TaxID=5486 RepID=A0A367XVW1_9ASCO|nr:Epsin-4 [Candida viswanathii]
MPLFQTIKNLTSSTESKIRSATNTEPLGPYNHELTEIARLTFNKKHLSIIISIINKRLKPILQSRESTAPSVKRSNSSLTPHKPSYGAPRRSNTVAGGSLSTVAHRQTLDDKIYLSLLKTLTVILYILQNGSVQFIDWLLKEYPTKISPLLDIPYPSKYKDSIRHKIHKIISLLEVPENLNNYRVNIHKLRSDMLVPGLKRTSLDGVDLLQVEQVVQEQEPRRLATPRITPTTPPILRLKSIHEHHHDEADDDSNYTLTTHSLKRTPSPGFTSSTLPLNHNPTNVSTVSNPHQLSPIF